LKVWDLKLWNRGHLQWHDLPVEVGENLPVGLKVIGGTHRLTDRQSGYLLSLSFLKESRLKMTYPSEPKLYKMKLNSLITAQKNTCPQDHLSLFLQVLPIAIMST
jgi:hypothetical protein